MSLEFAQDWRGVAMIDASKARESFRDVLDLAAAHGGRLVIKRNGRPVAAMVSMGELGDLLDRDELADEAMIAAEPHAARASRSLDTPADDLSPENLFYPAAQTPADEGQRAAHGLLHGLEADVANLVRSRLEHWAERVIRHSSELTLDEMKGLNRREALSVLNEPERAEQVIDRVTTSVVEEYCDSEPLEIDDHSDASFQEDEAPAAASQGW